MIRYRPFPLALRCLLVLALCALPFAGALAQSASANLSGTVTDQNGAVVPGATVKVSNTATGLQREVTTSGDGSFTVPLLPPATYTVRVEHQGFAPIEATIVLNVGDQKALQIQLKAGDINATVQVINEPELINESAAVGTVIDRNFVENLPLNGRSFNTLLQLTPGVVIAPTVGGFPGGGQFSVAGQRQDANNFMVDGVSANFGVGAGFGVGETGTGNSQAFSALGGTSSLISVDTLQEFRVETSSFAPQFGRSPGAQVILSTRSGTNEFHGGVFEFFRNDALDANDWFANQAGQPRAAERHNDFGGFAGGPIRKDRTFFFISYEGARLRLPQSVVIPVPSAFARVSAPPAIAPYLNAYPQPDNRTVIPGVFTARFTGSWSNSGTLNAGSVRIDQTFNSKWSVFARYDDAPSDFTPRVFDRATLNPETVNTRTLTAGINMLLTPRIINTVRANYSTQRATLSTAVDSFGGAVPPASSLVLGSLSVATNSAFFQTNDTARWQIGVAGANRTRQANIVDDLSVRSGTHQLKFGTDYRAILLDRNPFNNQVGFRVSSIRQFINTGTVRLSINSQRPGQLLAQSLSLYGQDTWKATPRLTLTYGMRWEWAPAPSGRGNTILASWMNTDDPLRIALAPNGTSVWKTTYGNFAPRIGVAYRLNQKGSFVLRAGGGIFYDLGTGDFADLILQFPNGTSSFNPSVSVPVSDLTPFLPAPASLQPPFPNGVYGYASNLKLPRSYQWNVALERFLGGNQMITATYTGQAGRNLTRQEALFQPNPNFLGEFVLTYNGARSNYNALQLQYRRPLSRRVQALVNYTWSHSLDNASNDFVIGQSNTVISAATDYGSSDFDVRHSFSGALTYDIPGVSKFRPLSLLTRDWSVDAVIVSRSGFPFNAIVFGSSPDPGGFATSRPDLVPGQPIWLFGSQCAAQQGAPCPGGRALNAAAFSEPATPRQGTEGRNDIRGFGLTQVDLSLARKFPISDRLGLQFRADAFNVFNHPNFANPLPFVEFGPFFLQSFQMLNQSLGGLNPLFQEGGPRSLQLSLKLTF